MLGLLAPDSMCPDPQARSIFVIQLKGSVDLPILLMNKVVFFSPGNYNAITEFAPRFCASK